MGGWHLSICCILQSSTERVILQQVSPCLFITRAQATDERQAQLVIALFWYLIRHEICLPVAASGAAGDVNAYIHAVSSSGK